MLMQSFSYLRLSEKAKTHTTKAKQNSPLNVLLTAASVSYGVVLFVAAYNASRNKERKNKTTATSVQDNKAHALKRPIPILHEYKYSQ